MLNRRSPLSKTCSWLLICVLVAGGGIGGCGNSSQEKAAPTPPEATTFRAFMGLYDSTLESVITQMDRVESTVRAYNTAVMGTNTEVTDQAIEDMATAIDDLSSAVADWEYIETRLQSREPELEGRITQPLLFTVIGVGLAVYGTYKYVQKLRQLNQDMSDARRERDEAETDTMAGMPDGPERAAAAKQKMRDTGAEAIETVTNQAVQQMLPGKVQTALDVLDAAGDAIEGVKVFTATKACATAPDSSDCKLTRGKTDSQGRIQVPSSELAVVLSKPGKARVAVDMVDAKSGDAVPLVREFIPIEISNPTIVAENDRGEYGISGGGAGNRPGAGGTANSGSGGKTGTGTGGRPGTLTTTSPPANNTTLSATFPGEPFNGMQVTYTITGAGPSVATDSEGMTVARNYSGPLGSGALRVAGTASQRNGWGASVSVSVSVEGEKTASDSAELVTPGDGTADTWDFDVSVPIPIGATAGSVSVRMVGDYNAGSRGLDIIGSFAPQAPLR